VQWLEDENESPSVRLLPVYPLTEGVQQYQMRNLVGAAVEAHAELLEEVFPAELLARYRLLPLREALPTIHFPETNEALEAARRRFVFQELFVLQLALALRRREMHDLRRSPRLPVSAKIDARIRRLFPFELTGE